jgi:S-adenosylmethionine:tRNA ribosyltransferase-isomerase
MLVNDFDFDLPPSKIALRPIEPREMARLLLINNNGLEDHHVGDLPNLLHATDVLVFNDTKVIPAQLSGVRVRNGQIAKIDATLHMRESPNQWRAFLRHAKKVNIGEVLNFADNNDLNAMLLEKDGGEVLLEFALSGTALDEAIAAHGGIPIPPYISSKRSEDSQDRHDYQTIYAKESGAVAAPTAGLHFTSELFESLEKRGISCCFVTLHVGAGTFLPVKSEDTADHKMHNEIGYLSTKTAQFLNQCKREGRRIIAVGTTSLRLLESASDENGVLHEFSTKTGIFITPGYKFKVIDGLMTNFHLPRSTLFMLVSALAGLPQMKNAYQHAINNDYRFYSYGDACLILRENDV